MFLACIQETSCELSLSFDAIKLLQERCFKINNKSFLCVLFGHVERVDEYRMARRVLMEEVIIERVRGRLRLGWMDGVKVALGNRAMTVEAERQWATYRKI